MVCDCFTALTPGQLAVIDEASSLLGNPEGKCPPISSCVLQEAVTVNATTSPRLNG